MLRRAGALSRPRRVAGGLGATRDAVGAGRFVTFALVASGFACASVPLPSPAVVAEARATVTYSLGDRAIFEGRASAAELESLLGVGLAAEELIDLLVGVPSPRLRSYEARWSRALPREITAVLPDGPRLRARVDDVETGLDLREEAFEAPRHEAFRAVDAAEARRLWGGR